MRFGCRRGVRWLGERNWKITRYHDIMVIMKNIIHFSISKEGKYYTASAADYFIVTQGKTFEELARNIKEAVEVYFHGKDNKELGFSANPSILANIEIPIHA